MKNITEMTYSYNDLIESFEVEVLLQVDDSDYQGDTRVLLRDSDGRIGLLIFGWGSCSSCDALAYCNTVEDVVELRDGMWEDVHWEATFGDMLNYIENRDWELQYSGHVPETKEFLKKAKELLSSSE